MSRRIDIELTSRAPDGSWTWRAAGARQPRGTLAQDLAPAAASAGDVLRVEVETGLDGIEVVAIIPARAERDSHHRGEVLEVLAAPRTGPDVSVTLAPGSRRRRDDDDRPRRDGAGRRPPKGRPRGETGDDHGRAAGRTERGAPRRQGRPAGPPGEEHEGGRGRPAPARRERRPTVSAAHRNALLAELRPEQLPVAEQLLRGGIPAVRQAIEEQNTRAKERGGAPANAEPILAMAEQLLPAVNLASWKDRATSAQSAGRELRLRELRAVVTASRTVNLDEEGRALAKNLQETLDRRVTSLREEWEQRITTALDEGRVLDALRITARAPEAGTRCPAELAVRLADAAGAAMTADLEADQWLALLAAVTDSPVRRTVKPVGLPAGPEVHGAALNAAGLVPELAKLLGLRVPPPPPRRTVTRRPALSRAGDGGRAAGP
ncbi:MAG TPA: hypothetical protein VK277_04090 [Acidimicrobiales bacterium]|nr:hypothetical protein [Acidimicrobiales bacterium]